jgi:N-acetylglucosamine kinase-like BadF-type ATPase
MKGILYMPLFGGVDGGGSKTLAVVVNQDGEEVGRGTAGTTNYQVIMSQGHDPASAAKIVAERVKSALLAALPETDQTLTACFGGFAGANRPQDFVALKTALAETGLCPSAKWELVNDAQLILYGLPNGIGLGLIAGTGSIAVGRDSKGNIARAGGWGYLFGDEGSGYSIGIAALRAASQAADSRGMKTKLLPLILETWQLDSPEQLINAVYAVTDGRNQKIAQLAGLVFAAAKAGDQVALEITRQAALELAKTVYAVHQKLSFEKNPALALGGGLLIHTPELQNGIREHLDKFGYTPPEFVPVLDPAKSAARACLKREERGEHS